VVTQASEFIARIGDSLLADQAGRAPTRLGSLLGAVEAAGQPALTDVRLQGLRGNGDNLNYHMLVPGDVQKTPELFWGPFMQLGTYMGIENPALRFLVDAVADPTNLLTFGTGTLLNMTGKVGKVVAAGAKTRGITGNAAIRAADSIEDVVKVLGQVGLGGEHLSKLRAAASKGVFSGEFKSLIDKGIQAAKTGEGVVPEVTELLTTLRSNKKAFAKLIELGEDTGRLVLPLQQGKSALGTMGRRMAAGQVNPLLRVEKPFAGLRSMFGTEYGNLVLWEAVPKSRILPDGSLALGDEVIDPALQAMRTDTFQVHPVSDDVAAAQANAVERSTLAMQAFLGAVPPRLSARMAGFPMSDDAVVRLTLEQTGETIKGKKAIEAAREGLLRQAAADAQGNLQEAAGESAKRLDALLKRGRELADDHVQRQGLNDEIAAELQQQTEQTIRQAWDDADWKQIETDPSGPAEALLSRNGIQANNAENFEYAVDEILHTTIHHKSGTKRALAREAYQEALASAVEHPEAFELGADGTLRLIKGAELDADLTARIAHWEQKDIPLREMLEEGGLSGPLTTVVQTAVETNAAALQSLKSADLIGQEVDNYLHRSIRVRNSGPIRNQQELEDFLKNNNIASDVRRQVERSPKLKNNQEKIQEARRLTEKQLLAMEARGLIDIERRFTKRFLRGLQQTNSALTFSQMMRETAVGSPWLAIGKLEQYNNRFFFGKNRLPTRDAYKKAGGAPLMMVDDPLLDHPWTRLGLSKSAFEADYVNIGQDVGEGVLRLLPGQEVERLLAKRALASEQATVVAKGIKAKTTVSAKTYKRLRSEASSDIRDQATELGLSFTDGQWSKFLSSGSVPDDVLRAADVPAREARKLRKDYQTLVRKKRDDFIAGLKKAADPKPGRASLWVLRGSEGPFREVFGAFSKDQVNWLKRPIVRTFYRWNGAMKGLVLNNSFFHGNVLGAAQHLLTPKRAVSDLMRIYTEPAAREFRNQLLAQQGTGAAAGAVGGYAMGDEEEQALWGGLAGLVFATAIGAARAGAKSARRYALDPSKAPMLARMGRAGWTGRPDGRAIGVMAEGMQKMSDWLTRKHGKRTLSSATLDGAWHAQTAYEHELWGIMHNGSKTVAFERLAEQLDDALLKKGLKPGSDAWKRAQLEGDREIVQVINSALGGHMASRLWSDPTFHQHASGLLLSPDWTVGNLVGAGNLLLGATARQNAAMGAAIGLTAEMADSGWNIEEVGLGGVLGGAGVALGLGRLSRSVMGRMMTPGDVAAATSRRLYRNALLGGLVMTNLLNHAFVGRWMHENPEGKRLSVALPGDEFYATIGKPYKEALEFASAIDQEKYETWILGRLRSKVAPLPGLFVEVVGNNSGFGRTIAHTDSPLRNTALTASHILGSVTPIALTGPKRVAESMLRGQEPRPAQAIGAGLLGTLGVASISRERADPIAEGLATSMGQPPLLSEFDFIGDTIGF